MRTSMQGSYCHQNIQSPPVKQLMFFLGYTTTISLTVTSAQSWESRHLIIQAIRLTMELHNTQLSPNLSLPLNLNLY